MKTCKRCNKHLPCHEFYSTKTSTMCVLCNSCRSKNSQRQQRFYDRKVGTGASHPNKSSNLDVPPAAVESPNAGKSPDANKSPNFKQPSDDNKSSKTMSVKCCRSSSLNEGLTALYQFVEQDFTSRKHSELHILYVSILLVRCFSFKIPA